MRTSSFLLAIVMVVALALAVWFYMQRDKCLVVFDEGVDLSNVTFENITLGEAGEWVFEGNWWQKDTTDEPGGLRIMKCIDEGLAEGHPAEEELCIRAGERIEIRALSDFYGVDPQPAREECVELDGGGLSCTDGITTTITCPRGKTCTNYPWPSKLEPAREGE